MSIVLSRSMVLGSGEAPFDTRRVDGPVIGWQNLVSIAGIAPDFQDPNHLGANLANPSTYLFWKSTTTDVQEIRFTFSNLSNIDYVGIAKHNFGSAGSSLSFQWRPSSSDPWQDLTTDFILANDEPTLVRFDDRETSEVLLRIGESSKLPQMAVIYIGKLLQLQRNIYVGHTPINFGRDTQVATGRSESGNFMGRVITGRRKVNSVSLQNLTPDWYRARMEPFIDQAEENPFFFAWRPDGYPKEVGFCWLTGDAVPSNQRPNGMMQVDLPLGGIAGDGTSVVIA